MYDEKEKSHFLIKYNEYSVMFRRNEIIRTIDNYFQINIENKFKYIEKL
jgi:hypothetical protein